MAYSLRCLEIDTSWGEGSKAFSSKRGLFFTVKGCNLRSHLQGCQMPDIENSRKDSRKGCRVGHGKASEKQPEKQPKHPKTAVLTAFRLFFGCFGCFSGCFSGCFTVTHSAPFSAVFSAVFNVGQVKGPRALPKFHTAPPPPLGPSPKSHWWGLPILKRGGGAGGGGGGSVCVELGNARGPFTVKEGPLFDENALSPVFWRNGFVVTPGLLRIIESGVPQAYVHARASSETLCSVHVLRVFLCIFYISKRESDTYQKIQNGLGYTSDTYPNPVPPCDGTPPYDYSKLLHKCIEIANIIVIAIANVNEPLSNRYG